MPTGLELPAFASWKRHAEMGHCSKVWHVGTLIYQQILKFKTNGGVKPIFPIIRLTAVSDLSYGISTRMGSLNPLFLLLHLLMIMGHSRNALVITTFFQIQFHQSSYQCWNFTTEYTIHMCTIPNLIVFWKSDLSTWRTIKKIFISI